MLYSFSSITRCQISLLGCRFNDHKYDVDVYLSSFAFKVISQNKLVPRLNYHVSIKEFFVSIKKPQHRIKMSSLEDLKQQLQIKLNRLKLEQVNIALIT